MTDIQALVTELEQLRAAIDAAITALRGVASQDRPVQANVGEGRQRQIEAMRRYWAERRAGAAKKATNKATKKSGGMTPEGRKRLSEAMRKRWAAKRKAGK